MNKSVGCPRDMMVVALLQIAVEELLTTSIIATWQLRRSGDRKVQVYVTLGGY
jgi:hypothetical protein